MAYIKNISHEEVLHLTDQISADKGQIVSKTLAQNDYVSVTLFAFSKDEEIATHDSTGDAMVLVLEGTGQFTVDGKEYIRRSIISIYTACPAEGETVPVIYQEGNPAKSKIDL